MKNKLKKIYDFLPDAGRDVPVVKYLQHFLIIKRADFESRSILPIPYLRVQTKNKSFCLTLYGDTVTNGSMVVKKNKHINLILDHVYNEINGAKHE